MFKVAPRYLSGVSVFLGDDITKREVTGEIAVIIGQSTKGPSYPVQLKSVEQAVNLYGLGSPLLKSLYEFNDGYIDSPKTQNINYVTLRLGGQKLTMTTSYGVAFESVDAYDGLEDDFFIYINDVNADSANIKIWTKEKLLVYDALTGVDNGYFVVTGLPVGTTGLEYGVDVDEYPLADPATVKELINFDLKQQSDIPAPTTSGTTSYEWSNVSLFDITSISEIPEKGTVKLTKLVNSVETTLSFRFGISYDETTGSKLFSYDNVNLTSWAWATCSKIEIVGAQNVTYSSSELDLTYREVYEKLKTALLEVEMYTPDYIVPAGIPYDAKQLYSHPYTKKTILYSAPATGNWYQNSIKVVDTTDWPETGSIYINNTSNQESGFKYTSITASGDYSIVNLYRPVVTLSSKAITRKDNTYLRINLGSNLLTYGDAFLERGYAILKWKRSNNATVKSQACLYKTGIENGIKYVYLNLGINTTYDSTKLTGTPIPISIEPGLCPSIYKTTNTTVETATFYIDEYLETGLGFVKETDFGDHVEFEWSDTDKKDYNLAHFGYLVANFCNNATVGYNTPLFGMNVEVPFTSTPTRAQITSWIGTPPTYAYYGNNEDNPIAVVSSGTGLLGDSTLVGSENYNRCNLTDKINNIFADPAYGLLLTNEGFIDGSIIRDDYNKLVDLGKFGIVGAGLLTFNNSSSTSSYIDSMGIYTLGLIAGLPKNEGASFRQIGNSSGVTVTAIIPRNMSNDLARFGYVVATREKGLGWVVNNDTTVARDESGYYLLSTTRTIKYIVEAKRAILAGFVGKPVNTYNYEAAKTKLAESFSSDVSLSYLNGFKFTLETVETSRLMGKMILNCSINPVLELVQVDINTVIDRNVTSTRA